MIKHYLRDLDADQLTTYDVKTRDANGKKIFKEVTIDDQVYLIPYKQYFFVANLNHGLAREFEVLPAELPFRFRFHRARSDFVLLKIAPTVQAAKRESPNTKIDLQFSYPEKVVPFVNPILRCYYAYSSALNNQMSRIASHAYQVDFLHYDCRQQILDTSLDQYVISIGQGPLPRYIAFGLSSLSRTRGNETESLSRFHPYDLVEFDLLLSW